jgi:hypothetical protein
LRRHAFPVSRFDIADYRHVERTRDIGEMCAIETSGFDFDVDERF